MDENEKKTVRAAAISYDPDEHDAPVLAAFGEGYIAEKIISVARESGVPIIPDPSLSSMLSKISIRLTFRRVQPTLRSIPSILMRSLTIKLKDE